MTTLSQVADVRSGQAFRGAVQAEEGSDVRVIQMRNVDPDTGVDWSGLDACTPPGKKPFWLREGDILVQGRGRNTFAVRLEQLPFDKVICTQHFFIIRLHDEKLTAPFLEWQLNQATAQRHIDSHTPDTNSRHITLATMLTIPIVFADTETQEKVGKLIELMRKERGLFKAFMAKREQQMGAIASRLLMEGSQ